MNKKILSIALIVFAVSEGMAKAEEMLLKCEFTDGSGAFNIEIDFDNKRITDTTATWTRVYSNDNRWRGQFVEISYNYIKYGIKPKGMTASSTVVNLKTGKYQYSYGTKTGGGFN